MSEHIRGISSPLSSSPGRPSSLSRPHWPWSTYSHRSSQSSIASASSTSQSTLNEPRASASTSPSIRTSAIPWNINRSNQSGSPSMTYSTAVQQTTRQWSFSAFEWVVRDVHKLRDFVEGQELSEPEDGVIAEGEDFEILKESPMIGDGKFKLEIARTPPPPDNVTTPDSNVQHQTLSVYITSLVLDFPHSPDFAISASMMTAIKCQDDVLGERGARPQWVWEHWQNDWTFRHESEVWECPLPPLSSLLENQRIRDTDSFVICVQIHCPVGPFFPQQPSAYYVPRDLLDGLEASLDNANTGDVRFVCLERLNQQQQASPSLSPNASTIRSKSRSSTSSASSPFSSETTARKRVIYAHSDILIRRSEYFSTMLSSSFSENASNIPGERKIHTIVVEEADFGTIYWLLKWVYANWLLFKEEDDPRDAVDGIGAGWNASWLTSSFRGGEWDWKTFCKKSTSEDSGLTPKDARSITSAESSGEKHKQLFPVGQSVRSTSTRPPSSKTTTTGVSRPPPSGSSRRNAAESTPSGVTMSLAQSPTSAPGNKSTPVPLSLSTSNFTTASHYPVSPHSQRQHPSVPDPHPHPTPAPTPASALSMYQVAHRYAMPGLATLALEHMMSTITPHSSFALLLATTVWDELHSLVEDYVVDKWDEVSITHEFEQCCQEVASGEWGPEGGKTLVALFRRLRSAR